MTPTSSTRVTSWPAAALMVLLALAGAAGDASADEPSAKAVDLVYDAADAIDEARAHYNEGRMTEGDRALTTAEGFLEAAQGIEPELPRIRYERARLQQVDSEPGLALDTVLQLMRDDLPVVEHVQTAELLDSIRSDLDMAPVGLVWQRTTRARTTGLAVLGGGLALSVVGIAVAFGSYAADTLDGPERTTQGVQQAGFALAGVGGGIALGGGVVGLVAQARIGELQTYLPGPWRTGVAQSNRRGSGFRVAIVVSLPPAGRR